MDTSDLQKGLTRAATGTVDVLYFARLREALAQDREQLALPPGVNTVARLRDLLRARGGTWETELAPAKPVRVAVNQTMARLESTILPVDEIAFFPPVTGG
jgi:molybdopterin synthase sulfur carrier subunit